MNHAELLKAAMPLLWDGVSPRKGATSYICYAISAASCINCGSVSGAAHNLLDEINWRLGYRTMSTWLFERVPSWLLTDARVQAHRLAWMQRLHREAERNRGVLIPTRFNV